MHRGCVKYYHSSLPLSDLETMEAAASRTSSQRSRTSIQWKSSHFPKVQHCKSKIEFSAISPEHLISIYLHALQLAQEPALVVIAGGRRDETVDQCLAVGGHIRTALFQFRTVDSHLETVEILKLKIFLKIMLGYQLVITRGATSLKKRPPQKKKSIFQKCH